MVLEGQEWEVGINTFCSNTVQARLSASEKAALPGVKTYGMPEASGFVGDQPEFS